MSEDRRERARRREQFLRQLAERDLYAWFGIPPDADDDAIRAAAERKRSELSHTPMPQARRSRERAFCDQGEKALLRSDVRRDYDRIAAGGRIVEPGASAAPQGGAARTQARERAERDARLRAARERRQRYGADDARMAPGPLTLMVGAGPRAELEVERAAAAGLDDATETRRQARAARLAGTPLRALALAERAEALRSDPGTLTTLGAARRDAGDLAGSESALRAGLAQLPAYVDNAPGWAALAATLRAAGKDEEAAAIAARLVREDDEDPYGWRVSALIAADHGDLGGAIEGWERSVEHGLDAPAALAALDELRRGCLARGEQVEASELERRIARLRRAD